MRFPSIGVGPGAEAQTRGGGRKGGGGGHGRLGIRVLGGGGVMGTAAEEFVAVGDRLLKQEQGVSRKFC